MSPPPEVRNLAICPRIVDEGGDRVFVQAAVNGETWRFRASRPALLGIMADIAAALERWERWDAAEKRRAELAAMSPDPDGRIRRGETVGRT